MSTNFNRFIEQQQIPYTIIGVFLDDENKKTTTGDHNDWSLEKVKEEFEKQKKKVYSDTYQMTKSKKDKEAKNRLVKYAKSLRFKYVEDWYIIDIDEPEINDIEQIYSIKGFDIFRGLPYKRGTTKGFHIFIKVKNIGKYKCETNIFKDIKGDLIKYKNNLWCYHNDDIMMYNFNEYNEYKEFEFEAIKNIFDIKRMNFIKDQGNNKRDEVCYMNDDISVITEPIVYEDELKLISDVNDIDKKDYLTDEYHTVLRGIKLLNIERIDMRDMWIKAAYIFMNEFTNESGFELWFEFSKRSQKFVSKQSLLEYWENLKLKSHVDGKIKLGTFYYWVFEDTGNKFNIDEEEEHYITTKMIHFPSIQSEYKDAIGSPTDCAKADLIKFLYPDYFVSDGVNLYILNYYGIYKKIEGEGKRYLTKIFDGVIKNLRKCLYFVSQFDTKGDDNLECEKQETKRNITRLIDSYQYISQREKIKEALIGSCIEVGLKDKMDEVSRHLIGFENGVYDIHKKVFRKGRKNDFVSMTTGYKYYDLNKQIENDKVRECYNVFSSLFRTEEYTRHFVKRLAFMMDGSKERQEFDFFIGAGGNGKSLISESIISKVFGEYCTVMSSNYLMTADKDSNRATPELAQAKGTRYLFVSEPDTSTGSKMQINKIKLMTGSDQIPCRFLRENPIKYVAQFSLIFLVNDFPELSSVDGGILRRPVITEFPFLFRKKEDIPDFGINPDVKEIDMGLGRKCEKLKLFFFKLFVENYDKEYKIIEDVKKSTEEYKKVVDPIGCWIKDYFIPSTNDKDNIKIKDLVDCYNIEKEAKVNSKDVVKSIIALGYTKKVSHGITVINKIKLKEGVEDILKKYLLDYKVYTLCKSTENEMN